MRCRAFLLAMFISPVALGDGSMAHGVWQTEKNAAGAYLEVTIAPCDGDATLSCGTITRAIAPTGEPNPDYENLGRQMIDGMEHDGGNAYSGGSIWDPQSNRTYKSKMQMNGDELAVDGCVAFVCRGQRWQAVGGAGE